MPELPEVETTRRGIAPHVLGKSVQRVVVRQAALRWPVPRRINHHLRGKKIQSIGRRGKYLLLGFSGGHVLMHLGMSGHLRVIAADTPAAKHDHVDLVLSGGQALRFTDPRRFGAILWTAGPVMEHKLLRHLGPEPLDELQASGFTADYLYQCCRGRRSAIKNLIMDSKIVVGVGNIYANEALFEAGIRPTTQAQRVSRARCGKLVTAIKQVLQRAIEAGGTTLRDFVSAEGQAGYFSQQLQVYGRDGEPCRQCGTTIKSRVLGQRSTYYCPSCQST